MFVGEAFSAVDIADLLMIFCAVVAVKSLETARTVRV